MNEDGSNWSGGHSYFHPDKDGDISDLSRPMTKEELKNLYFLNKDDDPSMLAELYFDFYLFSRIEFLIFRDRLNSAILISNLAKKELSRTESELVVQYNDDCYRLPGWEGESGMHFEMSLDIVRDAYLISIGATIVTAVAALESLLIDLSPHSDKEPEGLKSWFDLFMTGQSVSGAQLKKLKNLVIVVGKRRNKFAHTLTGSYFPNNKSHSEELNEQLMKDTLYKVSKIAIALEAIVSNEDIVLKKVLQKATR